MVFLKIVFVTLLLGTFLQSSFGLKQECPPQSALQPCVCQDIEGFLLLLCEGISDMTGEILRKVILATSEYQVLEILLRNAVLGTVPDNLFQGSNIPVVYFQNVSFDKLDPFALVSGVKDILNYFVNENVFANNWQFSAKANDFRNLKFLAFTYYERNATSATLPEDFLSFLPETMQEIEFKKMDIETVSEPGFSQFPDISDISLSGNLLREINRNIFPRSAEKLFRLDISNNSLTTLPEGIFEEMPALKTLELQFNQFTHFDEKTFIPIWNQLNYMSLNDNPLHCGCEAAWLIQKRRSSLTTVLPTCASPPPFKGRPLASLSVPDLCPSLSR